MAMMAVGAGTASAVAKNVVGCLGSLETSEGIMKCVGTYDLGGSVKLSASSNESLFSGGLAETCGKSTLGMSFIAGKEAGTEGVLNVNELSFVGECKPCAKVEATGLPYAKGAITMPSETEDDFVFQSNVVSVTLSGCPLGITCKFSASKAKLKYLVSKTYMANELRAEGILLEKVSGSEACGPVSNWTANYVTSVPEVWWLGLI
jgi:hypothetical protein